MRGRSSPYRSPRARWAWMGEIVFALTLTVLAGCASMTGAGRVAFEPSGPGAVFSTIEGAVVDAMAFSVVEARRSRRSDRMHGGAITAVAGGYTYSAPAVAQALKPLEVSYGIGRDDVARFHVYPKAQDRRERRAREQVTLSDRASVDKADPRHRPIYFLTPSLVVKIYAGDAKPVREIARIDQERDGLQVVMVAASMP